jgi:hypothetical protein
LAGLSQVSRYFVTNILGNKARNADLRTDAAKARKVRVKDLCTGLKSGISDLVFRAAKMAGGVCCLADAVAWSDIALVQTILLDQRSAKHQIAIHGYHRIY